MAVTPLDLLAALALLAFVSGMGGVTYRAVMLLIQLIAPKPHWQERGALLIILALGYIVLLALDVPSVLASLRDNSSHATLDSVLRTSVFAAWLWVLNTILLMLARGHPRSSAPVAPVNAGVIGLLLIGLALGVASVACWRFMLSPLSRWAPGLLSLAYYAAMWAWPHEAITAARVGVAYPFGDGVRVTLLGLALVLAIIELSVRLTRAVRHNAALRAQLAAQGRGEHDD